MPTSEFYVAHGQQRILELLNTEHAMVGHELEAKLSDARWRCKPIRIDPAHLVTARNNLTAEGLITAETATTRGGREITTYQLANRTGRQRRVEDAAARKRLLQARYLSWASGSTTVRAVVGSALEQVVHSSLIAAAPTGYRLLNPSSGQVGLVLGTDLHGPVDNAAFFYPMDPQTNTPGRGMYVVLVEAKNLRDWIYPGAVELFQLLDKAAQLQLNHPENDIIPVLVCRVAHHLTRQMANDLGFYVIETRRQYITLSVAEDDVAEVNDALAYNLDRNTDAVDAMVDHFRTKIPARATQSAERWHATAHQLAPYFDALRHTTNASERNRLMSQMKRAAAQTGGPKMPSWIQRDDDA